MAAQNLALSGVANNTATLIRYTSRGCDGLKVQYVGVNSDDSLAAPRIIDVKLTIKSPGLTGNDRIEVSMKQSVLDENGLPHTGSATMSVSIPRVATWTKEHTVSILKQMADYLAGEGTSLVDKTDTQGFPNEWAEGLIP